MKLTLKQRCGKLIVDTIEHFQEWFYGPYCPTLKEPDEREKETKYRDVIAQRRTQKL